MPSDGFLEPDVSHLLLALHSFLRPLRKSPSVTRFPSLDPMVEFLTSLSPVRVAALRSTSISKWPTYRRLLLSHHTSRDCETGPESRSYADSVLPHIVDLLFEIVNSRPQAFHYLIFCLRRRLFGSEPILPDVGLTGMWRRDAGRTEPRFESRDGN
jgi:hypothetical protein